MIAMKRKRRDRKDERGGGGNDEVSEGRELRCLWLCVSGGFLLSFYQKSRYSPASASCNIVISHNRGNG